MNCPRCHRSFDQGLSRADSTGLDAQHCPHCGARYEQAVSALLKTSTILISADNTDAVYHSVDEVPEPLREMLLQSTNGLNSGTILIADQRGKEQISKAVRNLPSATRRKILQSKPGEPVPASCLATSASRTIFGYPLRYWAGLLIALSTGLLVWLISARHW